MNQLKSGEAPGWCGIYAGMLKAEGAAALLWLHIFCVPFRTRYHPDRLETGRLPPDLKGGKE